MPVRFEEAKNVRRRTCGGCDLCCMANSIIATDSPAGERCRHMSPKGGCSIYGEHPQECRDFACLWLSGVIDEAARPDKCNVVFTMDCSSRDPRGGPFPIIVASEKYHGAASGKMASSLIRSMREVGLPVVVCCRGKARMAELSVNGKRVIYGPNEDMDEDNRASVPIDLTRHKNYFDLMGVPRHLRDQFVTGGEEPT